MEYQQSTPEPVRRGACHCGAVQFRVKLHTGLNQPRRCNCTMCRMRGAVAVSAKLADFEIIAGADKLALYQFKTKTAKHYFCSVCGIYTHHQRRSAPDEFGVNAACLEGVSPFDFDDVMVLNGTIHPKDVGDEPYSPIAGYLRFFPSQE